MSESAGAAITTALSILVIIDIVGNSLVCVIIKRNRDLRYYLSCCKLYISANQQKFLRCLRLKLSLENGLEKAILFCMHSTSFLEPALALNAENGHAISMHITNITARRRVPTSFILLYSFPDPRTKGSRPLGTKMPLYFY